MSFVLNITLAILLSYFICANQRRHRRQLPDHPENTTLDQTLFTHTTSSTSRSDNIAPDQQTVNPTNTVYVDYEEVDMRNANQDNNRQHRQQYESLHGQVDVYILQFCPCFLNAYLFYLCI